MPEVPQGVDVYEQAMQRIRPLYAAGHRIVVAFSGGKDSTVVLNLCIEAAREFNALPVEVSFFDEEIIYPGTIEYILRTAERPEVTLRWASARKAQVNAFSRDHPYWWTFDPHLDPSEWVRTPPDNIEWLGEDSRMAEATRSDRYPPPPGKDLIVMMGIRARESRNRRMSVFSSMGFLAKRNKYGHRPARPIFDWRDEDVWKAIKDFGWDYSSTYNIMYRLGITKSRLRVGPPTMTIAAIGKLQMAAKAWPRWFDKICTRLPGVRTAAKFGRRAVLPNRRLGETWEECYQRTCIDEAPQWIRERAEAYRELRVRQHMYHSNDGMPDTVNCATCYTNGSWKSMCKMMYMGDPFSLKDKSFPYAKPEDFRPGGRWHKG